MINKISEILKRAICCVLPLLLGMGILLSDTLNAVIPSSEREALIAIYNALNGDTWQNNTGWKTEPLADDEFSRMGSEGTWNGIQVRGNHVTAISFSNNGLSGSIPVEIGELEYLQSLMLADNGLSGEIPQEIGELRRLKELRLIGDFSGSIPDQLGDLVNLKVLRLSKGITGDIPQRIGNLINLESVILDGEFSGSIPASIGQLSKLTSLKLTGNFSGDISAELGNLKNLKKLVITVSLSSLNLNTGDIPSDEDWDSDDAPQSIMGGSIPSTFGGLSQLEELRLRVGLTGSIPVELSNLSNLKRLILTGNDLSGEIPTELEKLTRLEHLALNRNRLDGPIPQELGSLLNLKVLHLQRNQLTGSIPPQLGNLTRLRQLRVDSNHLSGEIPINLTNLNAYLLNLGYNQLTTNDVSVQRFLNKSDLGWTKTQTVVPDGLKAKASGDRVITLSWKPIPYQRGPGGYEIVYSTSPGGPWTEVGLTLNKQVSSFEVDRLAKGKTYYFKLRTISQPHSFNKNRLVSPYTPEIEGIIQ